MAPDAEEEKLEVGTDANGKKLEVGDDVVIRGRVTWVCEDPGLAKLCTVRVLLDKRKPSCPNDPVELSSLNASMVEKIEK